MSDPLPIRPGLTIPARDLRWTATRSSGPGGQNVNKVSSRVELRFDLEGTEALSATTKERLRTLAASFLDAEGQIFLRSEKTRDQHMNLQDAREKLRTLILRALIVPKKRRPTKPTRGSQQRRLDEKRKHAVKKESRQRDSE